MRANLFQRGEKMIAYPMHQTSAGIYMGGDPYLLIEDHSPVAIGAAVRSALAAYRAGIRTPLRHEYPLMPVSPLQKAMSGYRGARLVEIEKKEDFVFVPQLNAGGKGANCGYHELAHKKIVLPAGADDVALGEACLKALEQCEETPIQAAQPTRGKAPRG